MVHASCVELSNSSLCIPIHHLRPSFSGVDTWWLMVSTCILSCPSSHTFHWIWMAAGGWCYHPPLWIWAESSYYWFVFLPLTLFSIIDISVSTHSCLLLVSIAPITLHMLPNHWLSVPLHFLYRLSWNYICRVCRLGVLLWVPGWLGPLTSIIPL